MLDSLSFDAQIEGTGSQPLLDTKDGNPKDYGGYPLSKNQSQCESIPTQISIVSMVNKSASSMRNARSLITSNIDVNYVVILEDMENATHRYYLQSLKCKNAFLDLAKLSKG